MNNKDVFAKIENYYDTLVNKHGDSHLSCDYSKPESQLKKFKVLSEATEFNQKNILDVGCGTGSFYSYLQKHNNVRSYTGIDLSAKMIDICKAKFPTTTFQHKNIFDITEKYDFIIANGIFYLLGDNAMEKMKEIITHMFKLTKVGIAFNTLSIWANYQEQNEFYAEPLQTIEFCRKLTTNIVLRHDYLQHDFTIYMYK